MIRLSQGMYSDLNCDVFGLTYNQIRSDDLIRNAGWFNKEGQKLGQGDLNREDLGKICSEIPYNDLFIVLSEEDTNWSMPKGLDKTNPGIDYVMQHAVWLVVGSNDSTIHKVLDRQGGFNLVLSTNFSYQEVNRIELFNSLNYKNGKFGDDDPPIIEGIDFGVLPVEAPYYGMQTYRLSDQSLWAAGDLSQLTEACLMYISNNIWDSNIKNMSRFTILSDHDIEIVEDMIENHLEYSSNIIRLLLGDRINEYVEYYLTELISTKPDPAGFLLGLYDGQTYASDVVPGLPLGLNAIRIE